MKRRNLPLILMILLLFTIKGIQTSLFSQWEKEVIGHGFHGAIAVDPGGNIHTCFLSQYYRGKLIYAYKGADNWIMNTLVNRNVVYQCDIVVDHAGNIHIAFVEVNDDTDQYILKYTHWEGISWSSPVTVATSDYGIWAISLDADKDGFLHTGYVQSRGMASEGPLVYLNNVDGSWKEKYRSAALSDRVYDYASMAVDSNGFVHFASYNLTYGGPAYRTNAPNGSLSDPVFFHDDWIGGQMEGMQIDIAVDPGNKPHISYVGRNRGEDGEEDHRYATNKPGHWITQKVDNGYWYSAGHAIASDPGGVIHIAYIHMETGELRYAMNYSGSWPHETIDKPGADYNRRVDMVTDKHGAAHILYEDGEYTLYATNRVEIPAPNIVLSPPYLEFGTVDTGDVSTLPLYIKNEGVLDLHISDVKISGGNSGEFSVEHTCDIIIPEESCAVLITFAPEFLGEKRTTLEITSDDPDTPVIKALITGRTPYPVIETEPDKLIFDPVETGETGTLPLDILNVGDADLELEMFQIKGYDPDEYSVRSTCLVIPPSESCEISVDFTPSSQGSKMAELYIYSNDPEKPWIIVPLWGRSPSGRMEIPDIQDNILDFGTVPMGKVAEKLLILNNTGERDLVISSRSISGTDAALFHASNACGLILPGESCSIEMIFHPIATGLKTATFTITTNDPDLPEFNLTLRGTGGVSESWSFTYATDDKDRFYCMDTLSSGDFMVGGISGSAAAGSASNAYLARLAPDGSIMWQKEYSSGIGGGSIHVVRETRDNGLVVAGRSGQHFRWIAGLDQDGEIIWQKQTKEDYWAKIRDLQVTSDLGFIAVGEVWPRGPGDPDMWIGKFDSNGNVLWQKMVGVYQKYERAHSVLETDDGSFIVAGSTTPDHSPYHSLQKHPDGGYLYGGYETKMWKFSPDGNLIWQKDLDIHPGIKFWVAHISAGDEILWQYSYPQSDKQEYLYDLTVTGSGDIIALGTKWETGNNDMRVMRLTKSGDIVWQKIYRAPGEQEGYKVQAHSSGSIAIAGYYEYKAADPDGWFLLLSRDGLLEGCDSDYLENSNAVATSTSFGFQDLDLPVVSCSDVFIDGSMVPSEGNLILQNYCTGIPADADDDGVTNEEEYGPSGQDADYDGNGDGLPDSQQGNVASFHNFDRSQYVTIEAPSGTRLKNVAAVDNPSPEDQPKEVEFSIGFFEFSVTGIDAGESVAITLFIPEGLNPVTYYKYASTSDNPDPHWYEFLYDGQTGAEILSDRIILHFKDGARGDEDLTANGIIIDIGGPGIQKTTGLEEQPDTPADHGRATVYPNPFRAYTTIGFTLLQPAPVKIEIYNILGQKVETLINEIKPAGYHEVEFHSGSLSGGIYFMRLEAGKYKYTEKMVLLK